MIGYEFENILRDNIGYDLETKEAYFLDLDYIKNCAKDFLESDEEQNVENVEIEEVSIATISKGKVKGIDAGTATIVAYILGTAIEEYFDVTVAIPAKTVKLSKKNLTASVGDVIDLNEYLTVSPEENTDTITWTSANESIAVVEDGIVTILGEGKVKITVKAVAGKKSATITIKAE